MKVTTHPMPLGEERQQMLDRLWRSLDRDRMQDLLVRLVNIHSPTGGEREASEFMTQYLRSTVSIDAEYMPISHATGNVFGEIPGSGDGARLLLYCPIDTHIEPDDDVPSVGEFLRDDMIPQHVWKMIWS